MSKSPFSAVVSAILDHSFDHEAEECMCGHRSSDVLAMAEHVASEVLDAFGAAVQKL